MCRHKHKREQRCDSDPVKRARQQSMQRRRRANKRMSAAQQKVHAVVSATPFRPESAQLLGLNSYEPYYDSHEWIEYDDTIRASAARHGLVITSSERAHGLWMDDAEPAGVYEVYGRDPEKVHTWATEIAGRYNQDVVSVSIVDPNGPDRLMSFDAADAHLDHKQALKALRAAGIHSGREVNGTLQIVSAADNPISQESLALLEARLGPPSVTNVRATMEHKNGKTDGYLAAAPIKEIQAIRQQYIESHGLPKRKSRPHFTEVDDMASSMTYESLEHDPSHPKIRESYRVLGEHIVGQHDALVDAGYRFEEWKGETEQPYANSSEMLADLRNNKRLFYYATERSQDTDGALPDDHPMAAIVTVKDSDGGFKKVPLNDVFRGVHDLVAHGDGNSFGPQGERNAWWVHRESLPRTAHLALWNETRAQNTWTNAGPHMRTTDEHGNTKLLKPGTDGWIPVADRPFAAQKCVNAPAELT